VTQQQFIEEIKRLSIEERIALIEAISRSLREELETTDDAAENLEKEAAGAGVQSETDRKISAVRRLRGIIKIDGPPPSGEELKDDYTNYLIEKYS
jgi:hypothetical protein